MKRYQGDGLLLQASDWDMVAGCWGLSFDYMESFRDGIDNNAVQTLLGLEACTDSVGSTMRVDRHGLAKGPCMIGGQGQTIS